MSRTLSRMWSTAVSVLRAGWWVAVCAAILWGLSVIASQHGYHFAAAGTGMGAGIVFAIILDSVWNETRRRSKEEA